MSNTDSRYCKRDWCKSEHHHPDAGVTKTYPTGGVPFLALNEVSIDVRQGEFLGITGKIRGRENYSSQYDLRGQQVDLRECPVSLGG
jgi:hypothetical protein